MLGVNWPMEETDLSGGSMLVWRWSRFPNGRRGPHTNSKAFCWLDAVLQAGRKEYLISLDEVLGIADFRTV